MSDTDILRPLLPQCLNGDLTQEDFNVDDAMAFGLNDADYFKVSCFPHCSICCNI